MLSSRSAPEHMSPTSSSASGRSCIGSDRCAGNYIHTAKIIRGTPVVTSILRPLAGASSSSTSASIPDSDSSDDYTEIGANVYGEPVKNGHFIYMVAPNGDLSNNTSSRHPTIGRSKATDAQTPSGSLVQNLNLDFNVVRVQTIMETIQRMAHDGSPLAVLPQKGAEATNLVISEKSDDVLRREPSVSDNDWARHAQSEAASSVSPNHRLLEHDAWRCIT
jgi:hypothetical protein